MKRVIPIVLIAMMATLAVAGGVMYGRQYTVFQYGSNICEGVRIQTGKTPLPEGAVTAGAYENRQVSPKYLKVNANTIVQKDAAEKADVDATVAAAKAAWEQKEQQAMAQAVENWNNSKTNHTDIIEWENRFMLRLGQVNGILLSEGIITNALTPKTMSPRDVATYVIKATNPVISSVGIALDECSKWTTSITDEEIGSPPDGKSVIYYIEQH